MTLCAQNISCQIAGKMILSGCEMSLCSGEMIGMIGPNGAGKSSFIKILAGINIPDTGKVFLDEQPLLKKSPKQLAKIIAYLAQGATTHWPLSVRKLVELGRLPHQNPWGALARYDQTIIDDAMAQAEVTELADRIITTLSGGEKLRALIARLFATQPEIILADEPIAALDPYHQLHTMELFRQHCDCGGSAVVVLHDLDMAARFCDRLLLMNEGRCLYSDTPKNVLTKENLREVYHIDASIQETPEGLHVAPAQRLINRP
ncbi:MAG: ABC transporter ATP-binding protein [Halioglobus sp.]|nr:ABC transporter ATP-binding protein [Halioglobus sp.]